MREDMKKVIVSRPKHNSGDKTHRSTKDKADRNIEKLPKQASIGKEHGWGKEKTGLYGPMSSFLRSRVGHDWNEVYSEICANSKDSLGHVLRERIESLVELNCTVYNGYIYDSKGNNFSWPKFYVDPTNNTLCESPKSPKFRRQPQKNKIIKMNGLEYYKHNNIWYRVRTAIHVVVKGRHQPTLKDEFGFGIDTYELRNAYGYKSNCYVVWKQQANSKECKELKKLLETE